MKLRILDEEPYGKLICQHINISFPEVAKFKECEQVEAISNILIGTKELRYGSLPNPEHLVMLRYIIRRSIQKAIPIPILIPWGSIKTDFDSAIDIAEVAAIQRLVHINREVSRYYAPGLDIVIRVEDLSGYTLFSEENEPDIKDKINHYSSNFRKMVAILCENTVPITVVLETEMGIESEYMERFENNFLLMANYLKESSLLIQTKSFLIGELTSYKLLADNGWIGVIPYEQRKHYLDSYRRIYGDDDESRLLRRLALYLTGSWTKKQLGITGKAPYWDDFIQLTFVPPVDGLPEGYDYHYVYHRTLPLSEARTHIPPWRAKGYLKIDGNNVKMKLTSFSNNEILTQLYPVSLELSDSKGNSVIISTDYLLKS